MDKLDLNTDIEYVHQLHNIMTTQKLILVYEGEFSQDITKALLAMTERKMDLSNENIPIRRKIFNVMVECLQNICKHGIKINDNDSNVAIFMIGIDDSDYYIYTGNVTHSDSINSLNEKLTQLNQLDEEGLRNLYREMLTKGKLSDKGGAGLGLIDIARKSGNKLYFDFNHIEGNSWFYSLQVKINRISQK